MQTLNSIVFGWYPYLCLTVFLFGSLFRFDREQYTWRTGSSQLLRRRQLVWGSNLFHVGILFIFLGHFVGLLTPIWVFDMLGVSHGFKGCQGDFRLFKDSFSRIRFSESWKILEK